MTLAAGGLALAWLAAWTPLQNATARPSDDPQVPEDV